MQAWVWVPEDDDDEGDPEDQTPEDGDIPEDTPCLDTGFHDHEMNVS